MPSSTASVSGRLIEKVEPRPGARGDRDPAAERLDGPLDDIHADAAPGDVGDGRAVENRQKQKIVDVRVRELRVGRNQLLRDRDRLDLFPIDAGAVVGHFDDDAARAVRGGQPDLALFRLACGEPRLSGLDAVIDGVADHVGQRIGKALDDRAVDFGRLALGAQAHRLAGLLGQFAHDARHALEQRLHRLGADRHHAFLDFARQLLERAENGGDARRAREPRLCHLLRQHRLIDDQFADQVDQPIDPLEIDADRRCRRGGFGLPASAVALSAARRRGVVAAIAAGGLGPRASVAATSGLPALPPRRIAAGASSTSASDRGASLATIVKLAIVDDEIEHLFDRVDRLVGRQLDSPGQIGAFGIEVFEPRQRARIANGLDLAQLAEFAQQAGRLVALSIELAPRRERDHVMPAARRRLVRSTPEVVDRQASAAGSRAVL